MGVARIFGPHCVYCVKCTKFGKLFLRKVNKTVVTRCLDFSSKRPKMRLAAGLCPDPLGELKHSPRPPSRKRGPTSKGRGGMGGEGREGGILPDQSKYGCYGPVLDDPLPPRHVTPPMRIANFAIKIAHQHCFHPLLSNGSS